MSLLGLWIVTKSELLNLTTEPRAAQTSLGLLNSELHTLQQVMFSTLTFGIFKLNRRVGSGIYADEYRRLQN